MHGDSNLADANVSYIKSLHFNTDGDVNLNTVYYRYLKGFKPQFSKIKELSEGTGVPLMFYTEIRATTTHVGRVVAAISSKNCKSGEVANNVSKANDHIKRCELDCRKWLCIYYEEQVDSKIDRLTRKHLLYRIKNGEYLKELRRLESEAREAHLCAKEKDSLGDSQVINKYDEAVEKYEALSAMIDNPSSEIKRRLRELSEDEEKLDRKNIAWGLAGFAVAIIGIIINFI